MRFFESWIWKEHVMPERNERPIFEGKDRREEERRKAQRRKSKRIFTILKYLAVILFIVAFVIIFNQ
jgi:predicted nucleic acid-binding Zn ribbon protein